MCLFAVVSLHAEDLTPTVGAIEVYGLHKMRAEKIRAVIGVQPGGKLPASKGDLEEKVEKISGVVASRIEAACCTDGKAILYVGIEERGASRLDFHPAPDGDITLPKELSDKYDDLLDAVNQSGAIGQTGESYSNGYSLLENSGGRGIQQSLIPLAATHLETLHRVVRTSRDAEDRAAAAYILQYGPRTVRTSQQLVDDLIYALQDIDDAVRANAMRSLQAMAIGARLYPEQGIQIPPAWFIQLLNSIVWTDRANAAKVLVTLTEGKGMKNQDTLDLLRERALNSLVEMAQWHDLNRALPAFLLLGRMEGMAEGDITKAWTGEDREEVIKAAQKKKRA